MIELLVKNYLTDTLLVSSGMELPETIPSRFILVDKTGSSCREHIYTATVAVKSYGTSMYDAAVLNEHVKAAMEKLSTLPEICGCRLNTDHPFNDIRNKRYRYQAVFIITHYQLFIN